MVICSSWRLFPILAASIAVSGCSTKVEFTRAPSDKPISGVLYRLPATTLKVQATHEIMSCQPLKIRFSDISITPEVIPDPHKEAAYALDHAELRSWLKTIESAKIKLQGRMLKKVTYKAQDQSRETIKEGVSTAIKVALAAGGFPIPSKPFAQGVLGDDKYASANDPCNPETREALATKSTMLADLTSLEAAWHNAMSDFSATPTLQKGEILEKIAGILAATTARLAELRSSRLMITSSSTILPRRDLIRAVGDKFVIKDLQIDFPAGNFQKWFTPSVETRPLPGAATLRLDITLTGPAPPSNPNSPECTRSLEGVVYRIPSYVQIDINQATEDKNKNLVNTTLDSIQRVPVFQLGCLATFEVKNGPFQSNVHEIEFDASGNLALFDFADKNARAKEVLGTIGDVAGAAGNFDLQRASGMAELEAKKKELFEAEAGRIKAEQELHKARAGESPP